MKRTITLSIEVDTFDEYADAVAALVAHPAVRDASWTRGEEIRSILRAKHGMDSTWGTGSVTDGFGLRGSK